MMELAAFLVMLGLIAVLVIRDAYRKLITLRNRYKTAYDQIDLQLQRRYDLIPNLVETAKGYLRYEQETLEAVMAARSLAIQANYRAARNPGNPLAMQQLENAEAILSEALGRLITISKLYPSLKADRTMMHLTKELASIENRIAFARQAFNDAVTLYNSNRKVFPSNLVANSFHFSDANLLEEVYPNVRIAPRVLLQGKG